MEIPELIKKRLGDETIESAVGLGDEDLICFTPSRALLYRGEGLIGDESVDAYDSDVERLSVSDGRRKMGFTLLYVDREESFSVSRDRGDAILQRLLQSVLRTQNVIESEESVEDVYRFSELTVIITDKRLVKHIGAYVWDADYEEYPFEKVTGLDFEEGSVATGIVLSVSGRPQRFKAPNDEAELLRRSLTDALFEFYDVGSLSGLNDAVAENDEEEPDGASAVSPDIELDDDITPLVSEPGGEEETTLDTDTVRGIGESSEEGAASAATEEPPDERSEAPGAVDSEEIEAMQAKLANLTTAVKRQNELLKKQHETIHTLIEELQRRE